LSRFWHCIQGATEGWFALVTFVACTAQTCPTQMADAQ
jgi:hypothetical protein